MKLPLSLGLVAVCCLISFGAFAQTACPSGVAAGSALCGPSGGGEEAPPRPTGEWIKTWGAIATSSSSGDIGSSTGKFSEEEARQGAMQLCTKLGNSDCVVSHTYRNQCVAVVDSSKSTSGRAIGKIISAVSIPAAQERALEDCRKAGGTECKVRGTDCTKPYFHRY
ncbi:DUF4189 domain-containing protein [Paracidovorax cattleyae]|uniref:DUF4189 domain-containing protein n=1 Tax=Paracidovorax cattleyae TaxID=80868 RepID=A0A1H0MNN6_9BURK|nr:DUF4189 domain-containing protein [Paracidovorax cattleyae]AVS75770.1 DUF4189 domain-containing protein [Paracidovorax cattleyae]MBF9266261.1 DUF4189 domain-containing protein [Paracidovorax cattleyae]SDO82063.1 protein of unknown function [Paracidovorax cattleyae]